MTHSENDYYLSDFFIKKLPKNTLKTGPDNTVQKSNNGLKKFRNNKIPVLSERVTIRTITLLGRTSRPVLRLPAPI